MISGSGLDIAKTIGSSFMAFMSAGVRILGADTPTKISLPFMASSRGPSIPSGFIFLTRSLRVSSRFFLSSVRTPLISHRTILLNPYLTKREVMAVPAAPAPFTMIFTLSLSFLVYFSEFIMPSKTTMAVPCWSS